MICIIFEFPRHILPNEPKNYDIAAPPLYLHGALNQIKKTYPHTDTYILISTYVHKIFSSNLNMIIEVLFSFKDLKYYNTTQFGCNREVIVLSTVFLQSILICKIFFLILQLHCLCWLHFFAWFHTTAVSRHTQKRQATMVHIRGVFLHLFCVNLL